MDCLVYSLAANLVFSDAASGHLVSGQSRGKALNMDHFYKNIRNIFWLQQIGTIFIVSVAYSSVDIVLEH